ncbi:hypothetical protein ACFWN7_16995 [Agromyces sp. NPDC058484]|uniref:hypothetical protein n=1 Tax=Agromyces sp. NPDC058484 TaxID=3346524 RepID=UPI0036612F09
MPPEFWDPNHKPGPPIVPTWQRKGYLSAEEWLAAIEKDQPKSIYVPKLPRIRIVSGGLPGLGRRR